MSDLTFLNFDQLYCMAQKEYAMENELTDFSILLGACVTNASDLRDIELDKYYSEYSKSDVERFKGKKKVARGEYFLKSKYAYIIDWQDNGTCPRTEAIINNHGRALPTMHIMRTFGIRPALLFSSISSIPRNEGSLPQKRKQSGLLEIEYGYYPQKAVSKDMQQILESAYKLNRIAKTGNEYITDSVRSDEQLEGFSPKHHMEFELDGKRYIRVEANNDDKYIPFKLSNGESYKYGDPVWVEVQPVKWLIDEEQKIMLTDKIILAGLQYCNGIECRPFEESDIKVFLDTYLSKELEQSREIGKVNEPSQRITMRGTSEEQNTSKKQTPKTIEEENKAAKIRNIEVLLRKIEDVNSQIEAKREEQKKIIRDTFYK